MTKYLVASLILVCCLFATSASAQQISAPTGPLAVGDDVLFSIKPADKRIGAESSLVHASIPPTLAAIVVGKAKAGTYPLRLFLDSEVVLEGYLLLIPDSSGKLVVRWEPDPSGQQPKDLKVTFVKYAKGLTTERMKRLTGPAIKRFAGENPVQVGSTFIVCVTPAMSSVCVVSLAESGKDCAVEMLKLAADDMVQEKLLTEAEAKTVKNAIEGTSLLVSVTLSGTSLLTDLKDPEKSKKIAAACEALAGMSGDSAESMKDKSLKVAVKSFTDLIERTCLLVKRLAP